MDSLQSGHLRKVDTCHAPMVSTLWRFHCGFLKDTLSSTKDTSTDYYLFSLNFTSIEIEGKSMSSSQTERALEVGRGGEGARKRTRTNKGRGGAGEGGILSQRIFWMSPYRKNKNKTRFASC